MGILCAHLAAFLALRPQPQVSALETLPVPLTVSLLSASPVTDTPSKPTAKPAAMPANKPATAAPGYQPPSFNASYLDNPAPNYPPVSRRLGEQVKVLPRVQLSANGTADSVTLQTSSGSTRLDQAALVAVKKWRFVPAKRGGQTVSASIVPVSFSLEG